MRGYSKKIIRNRLQTAMARKAETRDAILWDVLPDQHYCRVKIQGSDELIIARYNENWEQTPQWLKAGNAVRIVHRGGVRGYVEIVGHGQNIPTAIVGGSMTPPVDTLPDAILAGLTIHAATESAEDEDGNIIYVGNMSVIVYDGSYRINGITYAVNNLGSPMIMQEDSPHIMGELISMNTDVVVLTFDEVATSGKYRYDLVVVGTDGIVEVYKGSEAYEPIIPDTPADHLLLGFVLIVSDIDEIRPWHINRYWENPTPAGMFIITHGGAVSYGAAPAPESPGVLVKNFTRIINIRNLGVPGGIPPIMAKYDVHCFVVNQYGHIIQPESGEWFVTCTFTVPPPSLDYGWGPMSNQFELWSSYDGAWGSSRTGKITSSVQSARFVFSQDHAWPSFVLECSCIIDDVLYTASILVEQLDELNEPCWMPPEVPPWYDDEWYLEL
jgi:hypothetical protein